VDTTNQRLTMHRRPSAEEHAVTKAALDTMISALGLRPGDDARPPERGALARLAAAVGVSEQRVRVAYSGAVAVRAETLARWAEAVASGVPSTEIDNDDTVPEGISVEVSDAE
jgi:hypothetical protein